MSDEPKPGIVGAALQKELDRIASEDGSHVGVGVTRTGATVEAEAELGRGWSLVATATYYWNKSWDAAVRAVKRW